MRHPVLHVAQAVEHRVFGVGVEMNERHVRERTDYIVPPPTRQPRRISSGARIDAGRPVTEVAGRPAWDVDGLRSDGLDLRRRV